MGSNGGRFCKTHRACNTCSEVFPVELYKKRKSGRVDYTCKPCMNRILSERAKGKSNNGIVGLVKVRISNSKKDAIYGDYSSCTTPIEEVIGKFTQNCLICSTFVGIKINLDHCHITGKFRGWLCSRCNIIAHKNVTPELLRKIADYLENKDK